MKTSFPNMSLLAAMTLVSSGAFAAGYDWSGPYAGVHLGTMNQESNWNKLYGTYEGGPDDVSPGAVADTSESGIVGGVTAGYNFSVSAPYVVGIEGDLELGSTDGDGRCFGDQGYGATCTSDLKWFGDIALRLGYAVDQTMVFAKGGFAVGKFDYDVGDFIGFDDYPYGTESETKTGWMLGAGIEHALSENALVRIEADYIDFGEDRQNFEASDCIDCYTAPFGTDIEDTLTMVKVGLLYKF